MKVLFNFDYPFSFAHGGAQIQVTQTKAGLNAIGVDVEYLRWWDAGQKGDIIHHFGIPPVSMILLARQKKIPLISTALFTDTCNRSMPRLLAQAAVVRSILALPFGNSVKNQLTWQAIVESECTIVGLNAEKRVLQVVFGVPQERIQILPIGCEDEFLEAAPSPRTGDYLISFGTITARKRPVELAQMAVRVGVPMLFLGKPYSESDPCWLEFQKIVKENPSIQHMGHLDDRKELISLMQKARGFVLYSIYENWCIAADEASACGLPLLVPSQNWSRERFGDTVSYFPGSNFAANAQILRDFYDACPRLSPPQKPLSWQQVGVQLREIYLSLLKRQ